MQQYADIYSLPRQSTCFGCHAPIIRSTKNYLLPLVYVMVMVPLLPSTLAWSPYCRLGKILLIDVDTERDLVVRKPFLLVMFKEDCNMKIYHQYISSVCCTRRLYSMVELLGEIWQLSWFILVDNMACLNFNNSFQLFVAIFSHAIDRL